MANRVVGWLIVLVFCLVPPSASAAPPDSPAMIACDGALETGAPAVEACEQAVREQPDFAYARAALAVALLTRESHSDRGRARNLIEQALAEAPNDFEVQTLGCEVWLMLNEPKLAKRANLRMLAIADQNWRGHYFAAVIALTEAEGWTAYQEYRETRSLNAPPEALAHLEGLLEEYVPWHIRAAAIGVPVFGLFFATWLFVLVGLIVGGLLLSRSTLRHAQDIAASTSGEGTPAEQRLRKMYRAVLVICSAFYYASLPMVVLVLVAVFAGIMLLQFAIGFISFKISAIVAVLAFASVIAVLRSIFVRVTESDPGVALDVAEHPRLRALLTGVAGRLETRPVDAVYMTPGTELAVYERGTLVEQLRGKTRRCLILGAGMLGALDVRELSSVLAHEYGHFKNADTSGGSFALATRRSLMTMANHIAQAGAAGWYNPAWLFLVGYHELFLRISQGASRQQEILADRWAAQTYGSASFIRGMGKVIEQDLRFGAHIDATLQEALDRKTALVNLYRYQPSEPIDAVAFEAKLREVLDAEPSPYDSHPRPADRMTWVERLAYPEPALAPGEDESAWSLFEEPEQLEEEMTEQVREQVELRFGVQFANEDEAED